MHALGLVQQHDPWPQRVGVIGGGAIGLCQALVAQARGIPHVELCDLSPDRLAAARRAGITVSEGELDGEFDVVFDTVGIASTRGASLRLVRPGGTAMWVGLHGPDADLDGRAMIRNEIRVLTTFGYSSQEFAIAVDFVSRLTPDWVQTAPLGSGAAAFTGLLSGPGGSHQDNARQLIESDEQKRRAMPVPNRVARTAQTSPGSGDGEAASSSVKSARRVLDILELLGANVEGLKFPQIAELLGLPKSSLHALLATLHAKKWIAFDEASRTYRIGVRAWEVGQGYLHARDLALVADEHLRAARAELNETIQLGVLDGVEVLYIAKVDADRPFRLVSRAGMRLPAWATGLGKVLLAYLPPAELRRRMAERAVRAVHRQDDYATWPSWSASWPGSGPRASAATRASTPPFVYCVAAPVRDKTGAVVAAMSCALPEPPQRRPAVTGTWPR